MNKAQKLLLPMIDAQDKLWSTSQNELDYERGYIGGTCTGLEIARDVLATLTDDITLADVPAVEWVSKDVGHSINWTTQIESDWDIYELDKGTHYRRCDAVPDEGTGKSFPLIEHARRYVEIRIHLADIERKLLAELAGGV